MNAETMKLEPCPFCGGGAELWRAHPDRPTRKAWIACMAGCAVLTKEHDTDAEAIAAWNRRSTPTGRVTREAMVTAVGEAVEYLDWAGAERAVDTILAMISAAPALEGEGESSGAESAASPIASGAGTAGASQCQSKWQDIASAPRDGTFVMLWLGAIYEEVVIRRWDWRVEKWVDRDEMIETGSLLPTHWLPLPPPPSPDAEPSAAGGA